MKETNLNLTFPLETIYEDASFQLEDLDKVGVVGVNGAGSSGTLMAAPAGKGLSHNNMQPYLAIYIWKRIS